MKKLKDRVKQGFTLAEVLITLAVIGVVAALTIPALIQDTKNDQHKAGWKKVFSQFSQIHRDFMKDNLLPFESETVAINALLENLDVVKNCTDYVAQGCWHKANEWSDYANYKRTIGAVKSAVLKDGSLLAIWSGVKTGTTTQGFCGDTCYLKLLVDVNGFKGPNKQGIDIFGAEYSKDRVLPLGAGNTFVVGSNTCDPNLTYAWSDNGLGCSVKILKNLE